MPRMAPDSKSGGGTLGLSDALRVEDGEKEMMEKLPKIGIGLAIFGLIVASLSLLPGFNSLEGGAIPLMLIGIGSFFYIPGAFMVFFSERKEKMKPMMGYLRWIRLAYAVIVMFWIFKISQGS